MTYQEAVEKILQQLFNTQSDAIIQALHLGLNSKKNNKKFYVFGTGHAHMMAEELYDRLQGLDVFDSILMPELMLHQFLNKSTMIERLESYASIILAMYPLSKGDTIMLVSNSGRNGLMVEMAIQAKKLGANLITVTNFNQAKNVTSRHSSNTNILDYGDVNIDNCGVYGDACYKTKGGFMVGATSTITTTLIAQLMNALAYNVLKEVNEEEDKLIKRFEVYYFDAFHRINYQEIEQAAKLLYTTFINEKNLFFIGTGHGHLLVEEVYSRAGGFAHIKAILEDELMNHQGKGKSNFIELNKDYADVIMSKYQFKEGDTIVFCSNSGSGAFTNELAKKCTKLGVHVVALTNTRQKVQSKHPDGLLLKNTADLVIDNCCDEGDAAFEVGDIVCCPLSTSIGSVIIQSLMVRLAEIMEEHNIVPPIFISANVDSNHINYEAMLEHNINLKETYQDTFLYQHKL